MISELMGRGFATIAVVCNLLLAKRYAGIDQLTTGLRSPAPGTTVVWGLSPGAATTMTLRAESYGADAQLVAFMEYTRVILVAAIASVIAKVCGTGALHAAHPVTWFPAVAWLPLAETLALAVLGPEVACRLRMQTGALLIPVVAGIVLVHRGWTTMELPHWLLAIGYALHAPAAHPRGEGNAARHRLYAGLDRCLRGARRPIRRDR